MNGTRLREALALSLACLSLVAQAQSVEELTKEMIAGSDANRKLLAVGTAKYEITWQVPQRPASRISVQLSPDGRWRYDDGETRRIVSGDTYALFDSSAIARIQGGEQPNKFSVFIRSVRSSPVILFHLQWQGLRLNRYSRVDTIADYARGWQARGVKDIEVSRRDGLLHVTTDEGRWNAVVSPTEGYCVREFERTSPKDQATPLTEIASTYRQLPNGGFVCDSSSVINRSFPRGTDRLKIASQYAVRLITASLAAPNQAAFTLAGMGVPTGVRIQDQIRMREYIHDVTPINEADLFLPKIEGPDASK